MNLYLGTYIHFMKQNLLKYKWIVWKNPTAKINVFCHCISVSWSRRQYISFMSINYILFRLYIIENLIGRRHIEFFDTLYHIFYQSLSSHLGCSSSQRNINIHTPENHYSPSSRVNPGTSSTFFRVSDVRHTYVTTSRA